KPRNEQDDESDAPDEVGVKGGKSCRRLYAEQNAAEYNAENKRDDAADKEGFALVNDAFRDFRVRTHFAACRADADPVLCGARFQIGEVDPVQRLRAFLRGRSRFGSESVCIQTVYDRFIIFRFGG